MLNFEPITLEKQKLYNEYFSITPEQSADYTFINLFGLRNTYGLEWAFDDNLVWIRQKSPYTLYWAPVGNWFETSFRYGVTPCEINGETILRIPKTLALYWQKNTKIKVRELRDEWEYIYDFKELVDLSGKKFHNKKNLVNQFEKNDYVYKPIDKSLVSAILEFEEKWEEDERLTENEEHDENEEAFDKKKIITHEVRAEADVTMIAALLENWDSIDDIKGGALIINDRVVAYTIADGTMRDTLVVHSERGDRNYKGAYQAINRIFLQNNSNERYLFVNREQDVGDLGLRKAKMSYHPIGFVEKYSGHCSEEA